MLLLLLLWLFLGKPKEIGGDRLCFLAGLQLGIVWNNGCRLRRSSRVVGEEDTISKLLKLTVKIKVILKDMHVSKKVRCFLDPLLLSHPLVENNVPLNYYCSVLTDLIPSLARPTASKPSLHWVSQAQTTHGAHKILIGFVEGERQTVKDIMSQPQSQTALE